METINKLLGVLSSIPNDKLLHNFYGSLIFVLLLAVLPVLHAFYVVCTIAVLKEIFDQYKYKGFDYKDIIATIFIPFLFVINFIIRS